jgi:uncharacterized membrane protein
VSSGARTTPTLPAWRAGRVPLRRATRHAVPRHRSPAAAPTAGSTPHRRVDAAPRLPRPPELPGLRSLASVVLLLVVAEVVVVTDAGGPVVRALVGASVLVVLPVTLLFHKVRWAVPWAVERLLYSVGVLVLALMVGGLALNTVLPVLGVVRPLAVVPLVAASFIGNLFLLLWRRDSWRPSVPKHALARLVRPLGRQDLPLVAGAAGVLAALAGAARLNNGAGGEVATLGLALVVLAAAAQLLRGTASVRSDGVLLFVCALALLLGTSMRGWFIIGHDIQREYFVFGLTADAQRWQFDAFADAYNACLSITVLPAVLTAFTGLSGLALFKVVFPALFAAVPVATYLYSRRLLGRRMGLVSAFFVLAFPTFFADMPFMVRQQVAFFFLALLVLGATQTGWTIRRRAAVAILFGTGIVLSHYSTTYIVVGTLVLGLSLRGLTRLLARRPGRRRAQPSPKRRAEPPSRRREAAVLLSAPVVLTLAAMSWLWTGPVTGSGGHLGDVVRASVVTVIQGDQALTSADLRYSLLWGSPEPPQEKLDRFADETYLAARSAVPSGELLPVSGSERFPRVAEDSEVPPTPLGRRLAAAGIDGGDVHTHTRNAVAKLLQLLVLVGTVALWTRAHATRKLPEEVRLLGTATLGALSLQVMLPGISAEYGVLRAFQQSLLVLAPVLTIGCLVVLTPLARHAGAATAALLLAVLVVTTGLSSQLLGGYPAQLNQANTGPYHDLYYTTAEEVSGIRWLDRTLDSEEVQSEIVTDRYSVRRLAVYRGTYSRTNDEFFPTQLRRDAYVYVGSATVQRGVATVFYGGDLLTYRYPLEVLDDHKSLVYDNGRARVYR